MSVDVQCFTLCDHNVNGKQYREDMCPRCYAAGHYLDLEFDTSGKIALTDGSIKLQQEVLCMLLDEQKSDLFFPDWGSELSTFIGKKKTLLTKSRLEMAIRRAIEHLQKIQEHEAMSNMNISNTEMIGKIEHIGIEDASATGWNITIILTSVAGETNQYSFNI